jgi:phosphatidylethanolamine/phosphatidyl-N-methylethanolamine N-methyltransferase
LIEIKEIKLKNYTENEWYENHYKSVCTTAQENSLANKIMHRLIELPFNSNLGKKILEVGANSGEHCKYVQSDFGSYVMTDLRKDSIVAQDLKELQFKLGKHGRPPDPCTGGVGFVASDVQELAFKSESFDRVVSTCLFHHLDNPLQGFQELRRVTRRGGIISILVPNDPGMLYRILRLATSLRNARKQGLLDEARYVHAIAHRNCFLNLQVLVRHVFSLDIIIQRNYPFLLQSYDLNIFTVFHITKV